MNSENETDNSLFNQIRFYNGTIKAINPCVSLEADLETEKKLELKSDKFRKCLHLFF